MVVPATSFRAFLHRVPSSALLHRLLLTAALWCLTATPLHAHEVFRKDIVSSVSTVRIGALANRGVEECLHRWKPTAAYLERHLSGIRFEIVPLQFHEVAGRVAARQVHFIITNSAQYAALEFAGRAYRIAGFLVPSESGPQRVFGGVVFTRADRTDMGSLRDLKGKKFAAVDSESLGGWLCALREMHAAGVDPWRDFRELRFLGTHDAVLKDVLSGRSDAGTVRSSQLEGMGATGKADLRRIRVLPGPYPRPSGYPFRLSTRLYPEWPFAVVTGTDEELSRRVAVALLTMEPRDPAARASGGAGWSIPSDYSAVHELLRELRLDPYRDLGRITPARLFSQYWPYLLAAVTAAFLVLLFAVRASVLNRRLKGALEELSRRTRELDASRDSLQRERDKMVSILEAMKDDIYIADQQGRILYVNSALEKDFGPWDGQACFEYINDGSETWPWCRMGEVRAGETVRWERRFPSIGKTFDIIEVPLGNAESAVKLTIFRDITQRKEMEAERLEMERRLLRSQKLESIGVLAGGVAHDFNNLLTAIMGNLDLALLKVPADSPLQRNLTSAMTSCQRASNLVCRLLEYAGKGPFLLRPADLNGIVHGAETLCRAALTHGVELSVVTSHGLPPINADADQIRQVIMNLVINAVEAIGEGPGTITITSGTRECDDACLGRSPLDEKPRPGTFVFLEVADTGSRMDEETQARVFEPFFTTRSMGRGLGMAAVLGIVRVHGGAILLESEAGRGTVVRVLFPVIHGSDWEADDPVP